jgi:hypothetical protein
MSLYSDTTLESFISTRSTRSRRSGSEKRRTSLMSRKRRKVRENFLAGIGKAVKKGLSTVGDKLKSVGRTVGSTIGKVGRKIGKSVKTVVSKVSKGVWKAFKWIGKMTKKVLGKVLKFFGKIWNFLKKILFGTLKKLWWPFSSFRKFLKWLISKIVQFAIGTILGPLGQLIVRNVFLKGSMDKPWLMLLPPPVSLIGGIFFLLGRVKKGKGPKTIDKNGIILALASGLIPGIINLIIPSYSWLYGIVYAACLYSFYIFMFYMRDKKRCGGDGFKLGKLMRSANQMTLISGILLPGLFMAMMCGIGGLLGGQNNYVEYKLESMGMLKFYLFFNLIFGLSGYLFTNMTNNTTTKRNYCKPYPVAKATKETIFTVAGLVAWNMLEIIISNINCPEGEC